MRKTPADVAYLERLGPFFVGRELWQSVDTETASVSSPLRAAPCGAAL